MVFVVICIACISSYTEELDKQLIDWKTSLRTEEFPAFHLIVHKITSYPSGEVSFMFFYSYVNQKIIIFAFFTYYGCFEFLPLQSRTTT